MMTTTTARRGTTETAFKPRVARTGGEQPTDSMHPELSLLECGEMKRNPELDAWRSCLDIGTVVFGHDRPCGRTTLSISGIPAAQVPIDQGARTEILIPGIHGHGARAALALVRYRALVQTILEAACSLWPRRGLTRVITYP